MNFKNSNLLMCLDYDCASAELRDCNVNRLTFNKSALSCIYGPQFAVCCLHYRLASL